MARFEWHSLASGLRLREDDFSWQGSVEYDSRFFLRRSKNNPEELSEVLFGDLEKDQAERLLAEFVEITGGVTNDRIVFTAIGHDNDSHDHTVIVFDRTAKMGRRVMTLVGRLTKDILLDPNGNKWNAVLQLEPKAD